MKILHLSKFYPPDPGGLEHVVACLANGAAERGHDVRVVCATGSGWRHDPSERITQAPRGGVVVVRLPTPRIVWSQPVVPGYVAASRWPADVVYVHRPHPLADVAALRGPRRPTIVLHHSDVQRQRFAALAYRPISRRVARRASAVVVATRSHLDHAADLGRVPEARIRVIPFGVDVERFAPRPDAPAPEPFAAFGGRAVGLFVGRLVSYKGLDVLVRAVQGTELRVVIVGDGPERAVLEAQVREAGAADRVVFAGEVRDTALPDYYRAADYFVLPSTTPAEMFGISLIEAMACATPVISTALTTGVREVNEAGVTGLAVPSGDAAALRVAMLQLNSDHQLRQRLGAAARQRVEQRFTLRRMVEAHLELCEEIAKTR